MAYRGIQYHLFKLSYSDKNKSVKGDTSTEVLDNIAAIAAEKIIELSKEPTILPYRENNNESSNSSNSNNNNVPRFTINPPKKFEI
jgi:hypothetical protein